MAKRKTNIIPYRKDLKEKARKLRNNATPGEKRLWKHISRKQIHGYDFDRQKPIDRFIVDFYCKDLKLAIELDGQSHDFKVEYDLIRQKRLEYFGIKMIRFEERDVLKDLDNVLLEIEYWVQKLADINDG